MKTFAKTAFGAVVALGIAGSAQAANLKDPMQVTSAGVVQGGAS